MLTPVKKHAFFWPVCWMICWIVLFPVFQSKAQTQPSPTTKLTWHGHSAFEIVTPNGKRLLIDPWLSNPANPNKSPLGSLSKTDYIFITHGHFDHTGDAVAIAKTSRAKLVANYELATNLVRTMGYPKELAGFDTLFNIGGKIEIADGEVTVWMTPAVHSSGLDPSTQQNPNAALVYGGEPTGFVIQIKNGPTIYDTGDTAYFKDMQEIARFAPDVALINIGGHFGMEPEDAVRAAEAVRPKLVIPHHFKTFPVLTQDPSTFANQVSQRGMKPLVLAPGQTIEFLGKELKR